MTAREITVANERNILSEYGICSADSKGRKMPEQECDIRTCFQRDRDRIIHSAAFRRLKGKTQVFLDPEGDHYRTRLTHTLEVSQIARSIARALRLNEDLTEAAALGHDLGHTPFGHAGERALNSICGHGFKHYKQSVRVCEVLEKNGAGLNLTHEVLNAIACHTTGEGAETSEAKLIRLADRIAYINHDIDDAIRAGVIREADLPYDVVYVLGRSKTERITTLIKSVISSGAENPKYTPEIEVAFEKLHTFMFDYVYTDPIAKSQEIKAGELCIRLYDYFLRNIDKLPDEFKIMLDSYDKEQVVCDYIAGMTDSYAINMFEELFVPHSWKL